LAELCGGSGQACDLRVVTLPFKQYGGASGAKRMCIVKADVAIGMYGVGEATAAAEYRAGTKRNGFCRPHSFFFQ
jgi:hypothetical protein